MSSHYASHNIIVRQRHVENVCEGLISQNSPISKNKIFTSFTPDSLAEQRRSYLTTSEFSPKLPLPDTNNSIYSPITPPALTLTQNSRRSNFKHLANFWSTDPTFLPPNSAYLRYDNFIVDSSDTPSSCTPTAYSEINIRLRTHNYTELLSVINIRKSQQADTYRVDDHGNIINYIQSHEAPSQNLHRIIVPTQSTSLVMIVFAKSVESYRPINPTLILSDPIPWLIARENPTFP
jgi:hypothetical protein